MVYLYTIVVVDCAGQRGGACHMPQILRGSWFSWEVGKPTQTIIDDISISSRGECVTYVRDGADYTFVFRGKGGGCFYCFKAYPRTLNVFEKIESPCVTLSADEEPTIERVCHGINDDQQLITLFNENYIPINCRSSLEGVWQFAYQVNMELIFFLGFIPSIFDHHFTI